MFGKKASLSPLYLYDKPFIRMVEPARRSVADFLSPSDLEQRQHIDRLIFKMCVDNNIVSEEATRIPSKELMGWRSLLLFYNFHSLRSAVARNDVVAALRVDNGNDPAATLIELHVRLGVLFDHQLLTRIITRVYKSYENIPVGLVKDQNDFSIDLSETHITYPFLWLMPYAQALINNRTPTHYEML